VVLPRAAAHQRAGVLSVVYVLSYLAMGVPAVAGGAAVVYGGGLIPAAIGYAVAVAALTLAGLAAMAWRGELRSAVVPAISG
jgi:hypothetical protein